MEENISNAKKPLTDDEKDTQNEIVERLSKLQGHWEGNELTAYQNRINGIEDNLPFFRD